MDLPGTYIELQKYLRRSTFKRFKEYLETNDIHRFIMFPRICNAVFEDKDKNNLNIELLECKCIYDFRKVTKRQISNDYAKYKGTIIYDIRAKSKSVPQFFKYCVGNITKLENPIFESRTSKQSEYKPIGHIEDKASNSSLGSLDILKWQLKEKKEKIEDATFYIGFKMEFDEKNNGTSDTLLLYPTQFGKKIKKVSYNIEFKGDKVKLKSVVVKKVIKDKGKFDIVDAKATVNQEKNNAYVDFEINKTNFCEAYFIELRWEYKI